MHLECRTWLGTDLTIGVVVCKVPAWFLVSLRLNLLTPDWTMNLINGTWLSMRLWIVLLLEVTCRLYGLTFRLAIVMKARLMNPRLMLNVCRVVPCFVLLELNAKTILLWRLLRLSSR